MINKWAQPIDGTAREFLDVVARDGGSLDQL